MVVREILFRIYDLDSKQYLKGDFSIGVESGEVRGKYGEVFKNLVAEQFTGLTDKNGVKIFENDKTIMGVVLFENGCFGIKSEINDFIPFELINLNMLYLLN